MKSFLRKITAAVLCAVMLLPVFSAASFAAVSQSAGMDALRAQWTRGEGPEKDNYKIDYSIFSPVANGADADKRYPLVVILPGLGESSYDGEELKANNFALWSSAEYQQKFNNGGSYIMIARSREELGVNWDSALIIPALKAAIDDFCSKNPNVDTERLYVIGWSLGSTGARRLISNYNNFIAAGLILSPVAAMSNTDAESLHNKAVWIFACKKDSIANYNMYAKASWNKLRDNTDDNSKIRFTTTETAPTASAFLHHNLWDLVAADMSNNGGCTGVSTIDGSGSAVNNPSVIEWLNAQTLVAEEETVSCSHICHQGGFAGFFYPLVRFFWQLFGIQKVCSCGVNHY